MLDHYTGIKDGFAALGRYIAQGIIPSAPTTASSQAAGANGATALRVNETAGFVRMPKATYSADIAKATQRWGVDENGIVAQRAAQTDLVLVNVNTPAWLAQGQERWLSRIAYYDVENGVVAYTNVAGAAAADGAAAYPTDAEIATALGGTHIPWTRLYGIKVRRTADTTLAITYDAIERPLGVHGRGRVFTSAI